MRNAFARGLRHLRADLRKYLLAMLAMAAGTAILFATLISADITRGRLSEGVGSLGGVADVGVVPGIPGELVPAAELRAIEELPGVTSAIPSYSESTVISASTGQQLSLMLTGYPARLNQGLFFQKLEGTLPASGAPEVMLPADIAQSLGVSIGDTVSVLGADGPYELTVVGIADPSELGMLAYENVFTDLSTVQDIFGDAEHFTRIDLQVDGDPSEWAISAAGSLSSGLVIQDTNAVTASFAPVLTAVNTILQVISVVALAITVLLAATAFGSVIRSRRAAYSLLRTVGASSSWIAQGILSEAVLLGCIGAIAGAGFGPLIGLGLIRVLPGEGGLPAPEALLLQGALSIAVCVLAALAGCAFALRSLYRDDALASLKNSGKGASPKARRALGIAGLAVLLASVAMLVLSDSDASYGIAFALLLLSAALLAPPCVALLAGALRAGTWTLAYASRRLHADGQMVVPAVIIAVIVAMSAALLTVANSIGGAMGRQVASQFGADVQITSEVSVTMADPGSISALPGVEVVAPIAPVNVSMGAAGTDGTAMDVAAISVDPGEYFDTADLAFSESDGDVREKMSAGAIAIPQSVADSLRVGVGDEVTILLAGERVTAPVAGVFISMATGTQIILPSTLLPEPDAAKYSMWYVSVQDGADPVAVRDRVEEAISGALPGSSVITGAEMRDRAARELATYTVAVFALVVITMVVGSVGVAGIFALSVLRRQRELATLRAIGIPATRTGRLILSEVLLVGAPATLCGIVTGISAGWALSQILSGAMGASAVYQPDPLSIAALIAITLASLTISSYWPVRRARKSAPAEALRAD